MDMKNFIVWMSLSWVLPVGVSAFASDSLTLAQALVLARQHSPQLELLRAETRAMLAEARQAGRPLNPEVEAEIENLVGSGALAGPDAMELTLTVGQTLERGRKSARRREVADAQVALVARELAAARLLLEEQVRLNFHEALALAREVQVREEQETLMHQLVQEAERLSAAGQGSTVDVAQARLAEIQARAEREAVHRAHAAALQRLTAWWGTPDASGLVLAASSGEPETLPDWPTIHQLLANSLQVAGLEDLKRLRAAELRLEEARAVQDAHVFAGTRFTREEDGGAGLLVGIGLPLPLRDRNQGAVEAGQVRLDTLEIQHRLVLEELVREALALHQEGLDALARLDLLQSHQIPAARTVLDETRIAHERGRLGLRLVLEQQVVLTDLNIELLEARQTLARIRIQLDTLTTPSLP